MECPVSNFLEPLAQLHLHQFVAPGKRTDGNYPDRGVDANMSRIPRHDAALPHVYEPVLCIADGVVGFGRHGLLGACVVCSFDASNNIIEMPTLPL